ncbi:hypothetical protein ACEPPN_000144 [Leptodophora sp. 'Broadleaf-Isolate-01']
MRHGPQSLYLVDCSIRERLSDKVITLGFGGLGGASIEVPLRDLILTVPKCGEEDGLVTYGETGHPLMDTHCACYLAINRSPMALSPNTAEITVLGDDFLRHAYVVYDLENNIIGMAPRNFDSNTTNIVEFRKGMMSFPNSSKALSKKSLVEARRSQFPCFYSSNQQRIGRSFRHVDLGNCSWGVHADLKWS